MIAKNDKDKIVIHIDQEDWEMEAFILDELGPTQSAEMKIVKANIKELAVEDEGYATKEGLVLSQQDLDLLIRISRHYRADFSDDPLTVAILYRMISGLERLMLKSFKSGPGEWYDENGRQIHKKS